MSTAGSGPRAYELTVAGAIGPVLRAALPEHRVTTRPACAVLTVDDAGGRALAELLARLAAAGLDVQEIRRLP